MGGRVGPAGTPRLGPLVTVALLLGLLFVMSVATGCGQGDDETTDDTVAEAAPIVLPITDDACLQCHTDFEQAIAGEDPKVFAHGLHTAQRIGCSTCHTTVGHAGEPQPPTKAACDECHGLAMPHAEDFGTSHGKLVREQGDAVCQRCHNVYLHCQVCHGLQMPHPEEWERKHGEIAYPQMQTCDTCHDKNYCLQCHPFQMPHPKEWTTTHGFATVASGSETCTRCHEPDLCTACHGMPMPHSSNWGTEHPAVAKEKGAECTLCHVEQDCTSCHEMHKTHVSGGGPS